MSHIRFFIQDSVLCVVHDELQGVDIVIRKVVPAYPLD